MGQCRSDHRGGDAFNYVVGLFYSDTTTELNEYRGLIPALLDIDVIPDTATYDAYAHANWKVLDETTIVGGLRFNYDSISYKLNQYAYSGAKNPGAIYSAGSSDSTAVVGDIGIKQQITPDATVYFTYTRGYAPEVYNTAFYLAQPGTLTPVAQESIDSFEIGTKGRYFDGTLQVNAALFDTVYNNFQIETYTNIVGAAFGLLTLSSAGAAESKGAPLTIMRSLPIIRAGRAGGREATRPRSPAPAPITRLTIPGRRTSRAKRCPTRQRSSSIFPSINRSRWEICRTSWISAAMFRTAPGRRCRPIRIPTRSNGVTRCSICAPESQPTTAIMGCRSLSRT
jgi:hypothetical protein